MGNTLHCVIYIHTGDRKNAGTDANVSMILHDDAGNISETIHLNKVFKNEFERGDIDVFEVSERQTRSLERHGKITKVQFWRDDSGLDSDWYVEKIVVENKKTNTMFVFPVFRWIKAFHHYFIKHLDTSLPQDDEYREQREEELVEKRRAYKFTQNAPGLPVQVESLPRDEQFSFERRWNLLAKALNLIVSSNVKELLTQPLRRISDFRVLYDETVFKTPRGIERWKSDLYFALQRIAGINNGLIELCTAIPEKLPVTEAMLEPLLEGLTIQQALEEKRLFLCDLNILEGMYTQPDYALCVPIGLFFVDKDDQLRPVAIQLFQTPGPDNPIFLPTDDPWLWELAKMWYNSADATYHQSHAHLGFTHLIMEGVAITTNRQLSQSHPVFKLLAPHFLYLIAINTRGLVNLLSEGGWVDTYTSVGVRGAYELISRGLTTWRVDVDGTLPADLKRRGLDDPKVLPSFHFRDDAMLYYNAIYKYVSDYLNLYYDSPEKLTGDREIQNWVAELVKPRESGRGGCGLLGVPGGGYLTRTDQLVTTLTSVIYTCSVQHAAVNFAQYDEYAFPPNYPMLLRGQPPKTKDPCTEDDLVKALPDLSLTLGIMRIGRILSEKNSNSLGDFEVQYIFDPKALPIVEEFRRDLSKIGETIKERNRQRTFPFDSLEPDDIPNSITT